MQNDSPNDDTLCAGNMHLHSLSFSHSVRQFFSLHFLSFPNNGFLSLWFQMQFSFLYVRLHQRCSPPLPPMWILFWQVSATELLSIQKSSDILQNCLSIAGLFYWCCSKLLYIIKQTFNVEPELFALTTSTEQQRQQCERIEMLEAILGQ